MLRLLLDGAQKQLELVAGNALGLVAGAVLALGQLLLQLTIAQQQLRDQPDDLVVLAGLEQAAQYVEHGSAHFAFGALHVA